MGWFGYKRDWQMVRTYYTDVKMGDGTDAKLNFYLYESNDGKRKVEYKCSKACNNNFDAVDAYTQKIYPWLKGMNCYADIPSYWDVVNSEKTETINMLYKKLLRGT